MADIFLNALNTQLMPFSDPLSLWWKNILLLFSLSNRTDKFILMAIGWCQHCISSLEFNGKMAQAKQIGFEYLCLTISVFKIKKMPLIMLQYDVCVLCDTFHKAERFLLSSEIRRKCFWAKPTAHYCICNQMRHENQLTLNYSDY